MAVKKKQAVPGPEKQTVRSVLHDGLLVRPGVHEQPRNPSEKQLGIFERATKLFQAKHFADARVLFEEAAAGPQREVSHNARTHMVMCDRRLAQPPLDLQTMEDHYNYAIERLNARDLEKARKHLDLAMGLAGRNPADYVFYALALHASLTGDPRGAYENLKRAIEIDPKNRLAARQDSDFGSALHQPPMQQLLFPEKKEPF